MRRILALLMAVSIVGAACSSDSGTGDDADRAGTSASGGADDRDPSWLLVIDASSATQDGTTLTLTDVEDEVLLFADRPSRRVERVATADVIEQWSTMFGSDPPNAAVSSSTDDVDREAVVELSEPSLDGETLSFSYRLLTTTPDRLVSLAPTAVKALPAEMTGVSLFVDGTAPLLRWVSVIVVNDTPANVVVTLTGVGVPPHKRQNLSRGGGKATFTAAAGPVVGVLGFPAGQVQGEFVVTNPPVLPVLVALGDSANRSPAFYKEGQTRYITEYGHRYRVYRGKDTSGAVVVTITLES